MYADIYACTHYTHDIELDTIYVNLNRYELYNMCGFMQHENNKVAMKTEQKYVESIEIYVVNCKET